MALAVRNEGAKVSSSINVTPMVDVMLVLLIIFMVVAPMISRDVSVTLVRAANAVQMPDADRDDALVVAVMHDGTVFLGPQKVSLQELSEKVKAHITNRADQRLYVKADARARYGSVTQVVDDVQAAGVDQLGLLTEKIEKRRPTLINQNVL